MRAWVWVYVNDIVCWVRLLLDLLDKLQDLFEIFLIYNISISLAKLYFNYPDVALLSQRVNSLGLTTLE